MSRKKLQPNGVYRNFDQNIAAGDTNSRQAEISIMARQPWFLITFDISQMNHVESSMCREFALANNWVLIFYRNLLTNPEISLCLAQNVKRMAAVIKLGRIANKP